MSHPVVKVFFASSELFSLLVDIQPTTCMNISCLRDFYLTGLVNFQSFNAFVSKEN